MEPAHPARNESTGGGAGHAGIRKGFDSGGPGGTTPQSAGTISAGREHMEKGKILRARGRGVGPRRQGRGADDGKGGRARRPLPRKSDMDRPKVGGEPQPQGEGRQRKRQEGKRKREAENAGPGSGREEDLVKVARKEPSHRPSKPAEPEHGPSGGISGAEDFPEDDPGLKESGDSEAAEGSPASITPFWQNWAAVLQGQHSYKQVGSIMLDLLKEHGTPLGKFQGELRKHAVAQTEPGAHREVLPISLEAVHQFLAGSEGVRDWVVFICLVLNFQYCSGYASPRYMKHGTGLSNKQKVLLEQHLVPAVERFVAGDPRLPSLEKMEEDLR